ncbi:HET-domain-containing protein [Lentithecium fluviatile CBS 122367]|uniref:HET-domain-containing protein n=1 Tax=Lentithecium fluviatile CBS 122367 TaxID=1168545 RepID=A0A6G1JPS5_9PLEO|nr:HET-domain-containing protein [Lentithecium fluviatile CBS 122367]
MRLLKFEDSGELSVAECFGDNIPPYAILSHTWGADHEEVTFKDVTRGKGRNKDGYTKIRFCGKQAAYDNLQYFWVDTCCINKSSSAELAEAINSMFRWYLNAAKCYVYLSDVSIGSSVGNDPSFQRSWKPAFQRSKWFTRGWTLQELLAPKSVEFFSVEGERLGDKDSMVQEVHEITGIAIQALQGSPMAYFTVDERLLWAENRCTKREEDAAYSLLGIFDVHMPLIYGEGRKKAFIRLRREIKESSMEELPTFPQNAEREHSRRSSVSSRRFSINEGQNDEHRIVRLEQELLNEKEVRANLEKEAQVKKDYDAELRRQVDEAVSTKMEIMENMKAQQKEFVNERQLLEDEIENYKMKIEEAEDEMDRLLGNQDKERVDIDAKIQVFISEIEEVRKEAREQSQQASEQIVNLETELAKIKETNSRRYESLSTTFNRLSPNTNVPKDQSALVSQLEDLALRSFNYQQELQQAIAIAKSENETTRTTAEERETELRSQLSKEEAEVASLREQLDVEKAKVTSIRNFVESL